MENIFNKYDQAIIREQDKVYWPIFSSNLNSPNQITPYNIKEENSFLNIKKAKYQISGSVLQADGNNYPKDSNVMLIDNFPVFLIKHLWVKKHGKEIDSIDNVGRCSLIKGTVSYSADLSGPTINRGFQAKFTGGSHFSAVGKLSNLCLGFFKDMECPIYKGGFEISFIRSFDDDALFREKYAKGDLASVGKIIVDEFNIRIPTVTYDDLNKIKLINELILLSKRN